MGGRNTKESFVRAITDLSDAQNAPGQEESHWNRFWDDPSLTYDDFFTLIKVEDIRRIRDNAAGNLTALCFKLVERLTKATQTACTVPGDHASVLNCVRLLTRVIPFLFEDPQWRMIFWSPANMSSDGGHAPRLALGQMLLNATCDLLFCPEFTVVRQSKQGQPDKQEDLTHIDSCEHLWEAGIACSKSHGSSSLIDCNRSELITLLSVCFSESLYYSQDEERPDNQWLMHFTSMGNRHVLPLLTSFLNIICAYDPVGYGVPYVYALYSDARERLVSAALQVLIVVLDHKPSPKPDPALEEGQGDPQAPPIRTSQAVHEASMQNLFYSYVVRLYQKDDLDFLVNGLTNLLANPLTQTYLPSSRKKIACIEELLVLTWKLMETNKKFLNHTLQSPKLFDLLVPILFYILDAKSSASKVGQLHVGIFIVLLMSGERNFGVRLNKPFMQKVHPDLPQFTGTHADLLYLTVHKIITSGLPRLQPLYDSLLTILVNVSPYLKAMSMIACTRLLHLMESFSTPWFLYAKPANHYLVFYLLETFNNIIQYQFDGNTNLIYCIIRSRQVFQQLGSLSVLDVKSQAPPPPGGGVSDREEEEEAGPPLNSPGEVPVGVSRSSHVVEVEVHPPVTTEAQAEPEGEGQREGQEGGETEPTDLGPREPQIIPDQPPPQVASETDHVSQDGVLSEPRSPSPQQPPSEPSSQQPPSEPSPQQPPSEPSPQQPRHEPSPQQPPHQPSPQQPPSTRPAQYVDPLRRLDQNKKKGSAMELFPLRQGVASNTAKLVEPHTPSDFKPTHDWLSLWKEKLPLQTISRLLQVLVPQVEKLCIENNVTSEKEVLEYLKNGTLVGLLPIPHPILIRKYQTNATTMKWFHAYIWGLIFVKNYDLGVWTTTEIKLFQLVTL